MTGRVRIGCVCQFRHWGLLLSAEPGGYGWYSCPRLRTSPPRVELLLDSPYPCVGLPTKPTPGRVGGRWVSVRVGVGMTSHSHRFTLWGMANAVESEMDRLRNRAAQLTREAERLKGELDRVQDEQGKIDYALSVLERVAETVTGTDRGHEPAVEPDSPKPLRHRSQGTYDLAVQMISGSTRTWRVDELVRQMREAGWDAEVKNETETVRAALSRAVASEEVSRISYGVYGPKHGLPGEVSRSDAGLEPGRTSLHADPGPQASSLTDAVGRNGQDMHANSSNVEPVSGQPLTDDAPAPMAGEVDPLKPAPSIRDAVLTVIQPGEDVTVGVVADRLKVMGISANRNTVSNELGRWAKEGKLERPARGIYRVIMHANPPSPHQGTQQDPACGTGGMLSVLLSS